MGRFISEDPSRFDADDPNLYRYVGNDPINHADPTGLVLQKPTQIGMLGAAGIGAPYLGLGLANTFGAVSKSTSAVSTFAHTAIGGLTTGLGTGVSLATNAGASFYNTSFVIGTGSAGSPRFLNSPLTFNAAPPATAAHPPINRLDEILQKERRSGQLNGWDKAVAPILAAGPEGAELLNKDPMSAFRIAQLTGGRVDAGFIASSSVRSSFSAEGSWHSVLDVAGFVPGPVGMVANGINAASYALTGDYASAATSVAAMIPFEKLLAKSGKVANFVGKDTEYGIVSVVARGKSSSKLGHTTSGVLREQPRNTLGQFAQKTGGEVAPGSLAERATLDAIEAKPGWTVTRGRVYATDATGQVRVYDGVATSPSGRVIGIETKSGTGRLTSEQRAFDTRLNSSRHNTATGIGQYENIEILRAIEVRR
jgi:hypothetical protein